MQIALINKINGKLVITDILETGNKALNLFDNWVSIDDNTKYYYKALIGNYKYVFIKEEAVLKNIVTKDDFIFTEEKEFVEDTETNLIVPDTSSLTEEDELNIKKQETILTLDNQLLASIQKLSLLKYIHYITLFNTFAAKGIFITEDNKEDKYIEILELDDDQLLNDLEKYLILQDELKPFLEENDKIIKIKEDIEYSDKEELEQLIEDNNIIITSY
jgi:hypothetical protein